MTKIALRETNAEAPVQKGDLYRVIIARPGEGSSGIYSEDLFRRDAHKLIPPGAQAFINHGDRDPEKMVGVYPDGGYFDEEEKAVVGDLKVFEHWKAWMREVAPHVGVSLYAAGTADEDRNVIEILDDPYNGADIVARPGLKGSKIDKLYESAVASSNEPDVTSASGRKEEMELEKQVEALADTVSALATQIESLVSAQEKQVEEAAQVAADEAAVAEAVEAYSASIKAINEADLFETQRNSLYEKAKAGIDVAPLIEEAQSVRKEALEESRTSGGRVHESSSTSKFGAYRG